MWRSLEITKTDRLDVTDRVGSQIHCVKSWYVLFVKYKRNNQCRHRSDTQKPHTAVPLQLMGPLRAGLGRTSWISYSEEIIQVINVGFVMTIL